MTPSPILPRRRALTLLELVIVLAILATLTAVATVATEHIVAQGRFDATAAQLEAIRAAVLGSEATRARVDETSLAGFVADMGRLPGAWGEDPETQLMELWQNPAGLEPYGLKVSPLDPEITLGCGWRGPYLRLPVGSDRLRDGWGRAMAVLTWTPGGFVPATAGDPIVGLISFGADGQPGVPVDGSTPLADDLSLSFLDPPGSETPAWMVDVTVAVLERNAFGDLGGVGGEGQLVIRIYGPDPTTGSIAALSSPAFPTPAAGSSAMTFGEVPIGPKVIRAYQVLSDGGQRATPPRTIQVSSQGTTRFELVFPHLPNTGGSDPGDPDPEGEP